MHSQLFVCYGAVSFWLIEVISQAEEAQGIPILSGMRGHSATSVAMSWATLKLVPAFSH